MGQGIDESYVIIAYALVLSKQLDVWENCMVESWDLEDRVLGGFGATYDKHLGLQVILLPTAVFMGTVLRLVSIMIYKFHVSLPVTFQRGRKQF